jgi:hypothetical protein
VTRQYDSFVLRCWQLGVGEQRIEVEHLQSGLRTRAAVLAAAVDWITTQCDAGARAALARSSAAEEGAFGDADAAVAAAVPDSHRRDLEVPRPIKEWRVMDPRASFAIRSAACWRAAPTFGPAARLIAGAAGVLLLSLAPLATLSPSVPVGATGSAAAPPAGPAAPADAAFTGQGCGATVCCC